MPENAATFLDLLLAGALPTDDYDYIDPIGPDPAPFVPTRADLFAAVDLNARLHGRNLGVID